MKLKKEINLTNTVSFNNIYSIMITGLFTSINAAWPGSSHDSHVLRVSNLCRYLEAKHHGKYSVIFSLMIDKIKMN